MPRRRSAQENLEAQFWSTDKLHAMDAEFIYRMQRAHRITEQAEGALAAPARGSLQC